MFNNIVQDLQDINYCVKLKRKVNKRELGFYFEIGLGVFVKEKNRKQAEVKCKQRRSRDSVTAS